MGNLDELWQAIKEADSRILDVSDKPRNPFGAFREEMSPNSGVVTIYANVRSDRLSKTAWMITHLSAPLLREPVETVAPILTRYIIEAFDHFEQEHLAEFHEALIAVAREKWPEMVEHPYIVHAASGRRQLQIPIEGGFEVGYWRWEFIDLEKVGPYQLGYGPKSKVLYIGSSNERP
jgi:hypothetical protein